MIRIIKTAYILIYNYIYKNIESSCLILMGNITCCQEEIKDHHTKNTVPQRKVPVQPQHPASQEILSKYQQNNLRRLKSDAVKQPLSPQMHSSTQPINIAKHGPQNYQSIKYLGRGTFGNVVLAEDKQNQQQYAMKIIEKKKIKQFNVLQSDLIKTISQNQLFVRIRQTFQNQSKIYVVMQYLPKGDIYYYLKKKTCVIRQDIIKMLVAQVIVGIQYLHNAGIIYRQLKPQNILVTNDGHIKLNDYGLSRMITAQKNPISTFIGTLQYTPPQAIHGRYDKKADLWAIGILMYQLKFQSNLFQGLHNNTDDEVKSNIQKTNIQDVLNNIVGKVSYDFRDVLIKLLQKQPQKRISLQQLKKHPFFYGIVWEDIPLRKNPPPLKQILQSDHVKFKDPNNSKQIAHRKVLDVNDKEYQTKLYQFQQDTRT